ncbi:hypothetical protein F5Y15DRAFT_392396 [Xylariaceae sp. FL0016]|nr:hypothetical protein F5Y15DRAFT_392396 [Xylariaceae sp. FL0016]
MAGLVAYESSDEEEEVAPVTKSKPLESATENVANTVKKPDLHEEQGAPSTKAEGKKPAIYGPQMGPSQPEVGASFPPLEEDTAEDDTAQAQPPGSPYTSTRALLRDLTLPTVPNMDIPPSPPGSPPPATSKKFEHFLELKKKGVHFNSRIAQNPSMRNPALMDKLMAFVELDQKDQYATTLDQDVWDPSIFPRYAYKEQLKQSQSEVAQGRTRGRGEAVGFVPASGGDGQGATQTGAGKRKSRFDM